LRLKFYKAEKFLLSNAAYHLQVLMLRVHHF